MCFLPKSRRNKVDEIEMGFDPEGLALARRVHYRSYACNVALANASVAMVERQVDVVCRGAEAACTWLTSSQTACIASGHLTGSCASFESLLGSAHES